MKKIADRDDEVLTTAWSTLQKNLNDENKSLPNGKFFLGKGGIKLLMKCKTSFPLNTALGEEMIKTLHQISLLKELRPELMSKKVGDTVLSMILDFFEADLYADANHYASKTLANLLSEGKTTWSFKNLSYDDGCKQLDAIPTKFDTSVKFEASYSFKTISPLLEYPEYQYFALWALKVQTTKSCCKYVLKYQKSDFTNVLQILFWV